MKYIALEELQKYIIHDGCDEGCGYIDERDLVAIPTVNLDKIRAEVTAISINGQVDEHTMFIRTGEQVKQMVLNIIDKYKAESEPQESEGKE